MNTKIGTWTVAWLMVVLLVAPPWVIGQQPPSQASAAPAVKPEQLDQLTAPIALYPDALVAQILIAATYPLEIVETDRWAKQNKNLKGDALTKALEQQTWDPSVKSLVNFPQVLSMMSEKLDWTQKLGDAFLTGQKPVMDSIQRLRAKAQAAGNLKTTKEQTIIVEQTIIKIEPATPQVIYVPTYNPTVVYGAWPYPAYPPYYYYPPGYVATASAMSFMAAAAMGAAWGYAWGSTNWSGGSVHYNYNQNVTVNNNINRSAYAQTTAANTAGTWQHNPANRQGVPYSSQSLQQAYNQATPSQQSQARQAYRGTTGQLTPQGQQQVQQAQQQQQGQQAQQQQQAQQKAQQAQQQQGGQQAQQQQQAQQKAQQQQGGQQAQQQQKAQQAQQAGQKSGGEQGRAGGSESGGGGGRGGTQGGGGAFGGMEHGSSASSFSQRGASSRGSGGGGGGGGGRSGGGGGGGGRRR